MKFVRTARGYEALELEDGERVDGTPRELSDAKAAELVKLGDAHGVEVLSFDNEDEALEGAAAAVIGREADLSAGIGAVYGVGDPVQTPGVTPDGDTPDQAPAKTQEK